MGSQKRGSLLCTVVCCNVARQLQSTLQAADALKRGFTVSTYCLVDWPKAQYTAGCFGSRGKSMPGHITSATPLPIQDTGWYHTTCLAFVDWTQYAEASPVVDAGRG